MKLSIMIQRIYRRKIYFSDLEKILVIWREDKELKH